MILRTLKPAKDILSHVKPANSKMLGYLRLAEFLDAHMVAENFVWCLNKKHPLTRPLVRFC